MLVDFISLVFNILVCFSLLFLGPIFVSFLYMIAPLFYSTFFVLLYSVIEIGNTLVSVTFYYQDLCTFNPINTRKVRGHWFWIKLCIYILHEKTACFRWKLGKNNFNIELRKSFLVHVSYWGKKKFIFIKSKSFSYPRENDAPTTKYASTISHVCLLFD